MRQSFDQGRTAGIHTCTQDLPRVLAVLCMLAVVLWAVHPGDCSQMTPPPPAPVPPNASHIIATVRQYAVWSPGSLPRSIPPVPSDHTLYALQIEIHKAEPVNPELDNLAGAGLIIEAFSADVVACEVVGKQIQATLKLTGDTRGMRWWISNVHVLP